MKRNHNNKVSLTVLPTYLSRIKWMYRSEKKLAICIVWQKLVDFPSCHCSTIKSIFSKISLNDQVRSHYRKLYQYKKKWIELLNKLWIYNNLSFIILCRFVKLLGQSFSSLLRKLYLCGINNNLSLTKLIFYLWKTLCLRTFGNKL